MSIIFGTKIVGGALLAADTMSSYNGTRAPDCCKIVVYSENTAVAVCGNIGALDILRSDETIARIHTIEREGAYCEQTGRRIRRALREAFIADGYKSREPNGAFEVSSDLLLACGGEVYGLADHFMSGYNPAVYDRPYAYGSGAGPALGAWFAARALNPVGSSIEHAKLAVSASIAHITSCGGSVNIWRSSSREVESYDPTPIRYRAAN